MGGVAERQVIDRRWAVKGSGDGTELKVSVLGDGRGKKTEQRDWYRPRRGILDETKRK